MLIASTVASAAFVDAAPILPLVAGYTLTPKVAALPTMIVRPVAERDWGKILRAGEQGRKPPEDE